MLTSLMALVLALAVFGLLGRPDSFDASAKLVAIEHAFHIRPVLCLPLVQVALAPIKSPPFAAIFLAALAGGCLAMAVAPGQVVAFSATGESRPRWLALIKGVWLALANGYRANTGRRTRAGEHASCGD